MKFLFNDGFLDEAIPIIHNILFGPQQGEEWATIKQALDFVMQHHQSLEAIPILTFDAETFAELQAFAAAHLGEAYVDASLSWCEDFDFNRLNNNGLQ